MYLREFPGSPVVKALSFHHRGCRFHPWSGTNKIPQGLQCGQQTNVLKFTQLVRSSPRIQTQAKTAQFILLSFSPSLLPSLLFSSLSLFPSLSPSFFLFFPIPLFLPAPFSLSSSFSSLLPHLPFLEVTLLLFNH